MVENVILASSWQGSLDGKEAVLAERRRVAPDPFCWPRPLTRQSSHDRLGRIAIIVA